MKDLMIPKKNWDIERNKDTDSNRLLITALVFVLAWGLLVLFLMNINREDETQMVLSVIAFGGVLALSGVFFYNVYNLSAEVFRLRNDSQAVWKRDNWIEHHLIPFIEKEQNVFVGRCLDKRDLVFSALTAGGERVQITVEGIQENGFSVGDPALFGYELTRGVTFKTEPLSTRFKPVQSALAKNDNK